jgi:hypothetical protein
LEFDKFSLFRGNSQGFIPGRARDKKEIECTTF